MSQNPKPFDCSETNHFRRSQHFGGFRMVTGIGSTVLTDTNGHMHLVNEVFYASEAEQ